MHITTIAYSKALPLMLVQWHWESLQANAPSAGLALLAAVIFGAASQVLGLGLARTSASRGSLLAVFGSAFVFWVIAPFSLRFHFFVSPALPTFLLVGLFRPALSASLSNLGLQKLGPALNETLAALAPVFSVLIGVFWLGEHLSIQGFAGVVGAVLGVALLSWPGKLGRKWPLNALLLPVGAALVRGWAHAAVRQGLQVLPSAAFAGMIGNTTSLFTLLLVNLGQRKIRPSRIIKGQGTHLLLLAGMMNGLGIFTLNQALTLGRVVVAAPISSISPLFTMLFGAWLFKREGLDKRCIIAALIIVPSIMLLSASR